MVKVSKDVMIDSSSFGLLERMEGVIEGRVNQGAKIFGISVFQTIGGHYQGVIFHGYEELPGTKAVSHS